jgi:hypothetical protein
MAYLPDIILNSGVLPQVKIRRATIGGCSPKVAYPERTWTRAIHRVAGHFSRENITQLWLL